MSVINPKFLSYDNIYGLFISQIAYGMAAFGLAVSLIGGEMNISIASILALSGVVFVSFLETLGVLPAFLLAIAISGLVGLITGYFIAYQGLPAFLVGVVFMISMRGVALLVSHSQTIVIRHQTLRGVSAVTIGPIPILFIVLVIFAVLIELFLRYTRTGRNLYAVGGDAEVASASGLNTRLYKLVAVAFSSVMAGIGGVFLTTRLLGANPSVGADAILTILPIVVIGGVSLNGGRGSVIGTFSGVVLMYLLLNIMSMFNIPVSIQSLVRGVVLLAIIVGERYMANRTRKI
jgi:ribose/xylose/arabinose/galactoside ABC-type transport system permease subunit